MGMEERRAKGRKAWKPRQRVRVPGRACRTAFVCRLAAALLGLFASVSWMGAQEAGQPPALKPNPAAALRDFEPAAGQQYELGRGDEIAIDVAGRPELSSKQVIGPDGRITLPLAGSMVLADMTRDQAAAVVAQAYSPYYSALHVTVGVDKYTSNQVLLLGAVEHPGVQTFDRPPTLLEVVTRGGALTGGPEDAGYGNLNRNNSSGGQRGAGIQGVPDRVLIYRGSDKMITVDLRQLLESGSPLADLRLKRDDIVYVPSASERVISVLGQVQHPGAFPLEARTTLASLLAVSGGLTDQAGRYPNIQVISPSTNQTRVISFKQVLQPGPLELTLHPGDVVYVPESGFNRAAYAIEKLSPLVTAFTAAALITH